MRFVLQRSLLVLAAVTLLASAASAQVRQPTIESRQEKLRSVRREKKEANEPIRVDWKSIADDFRAIQEDNEKLHNAVGGTSFDYEVVRTLAGRIRKRAERLETNLALPEEESTHTVTFNIPGSDTEMQQAVVMLDQLMAKFVSNPLFDVSGVVNVTQAVEAEASLLSIKTLSHAIRKGADGMKRRNARN